MDDFTPRNAVKFVARSFVAYQTGKLAEQTITDHTQFEEDDFVVDITGTVIGWYVSSKLKPVTDGAVDRVADFIAAKRAAKTTKIEVPEVA